MPIAFLRRRSSTTLSGTSPGSNGILSSSEERQSSTTARCCGGGENSSSSKAVWRARILFIVCLSVVAAVLGFTAHHFIEQAETELGETQFDSVVDRALAEAYKNARQKRWSTITMSSVISQMFPNASAYPFVAVPGFESIASNLITATSNDNMGFSPIVSPGEELSNWEKFIYEYYEIYRDPPFPNNTAVSSFGKGVWALETTESGSRSRVQDFGNASRYGSPNQIVTPVAQHSSGPSPILLFNLHSEKVRGTAIDNMIACSEERAAANSTRLRDVADCGVITDMMFHLADPARGPMALISTPIYPANDPDTLVGFTASPILWFEILQNLFPDEVSGIDFVLETATTVFTFTVTGGVAHPRGYGDFHQTKYNSYRHSIEVAGEGLYTEQSPVYYLSLYPNDQLFQVYSTSNPTIATIGAVCIIIFTSLLFFFYDFVVRREFLAKKELLTAKRKFMRFVSHEVRTPLNAVSMGLTVIQTEMARSLGFDSTTELSKKSGEDNQHLEPRIEHVMDEDVLEWFHLTQDIMRNTMSAVDVLSDVLNYDKIESGSLTLELAQIPIWDVLEAAVKEFKLAATKKHIDFRHVFVAYGRGSDDESPEQIASASSLPQEMCNKKVIGDTVRLVQVIRNLVSNALKFTPDNGAVLVEAAWFPPSDESLKRDPKRFDLKSNGGEVFLPRGGQVRVRVEDTGAGMSKAELDGLFREGIQFHANELQEGKGSGFGLYIAKGIVEMHGGTLYAESRGRGEGTTFFMLLPLYHSPDTCKEESINGSQASGCEDSNNLQVEFLTLNVLVVDDALSNRKLLGRLLKNAGHSIDLAEDGEVALQMFTEKLSSGHPYDTVLLDYEMPIMNGPTTAKEIRSAGSDVFIVGITGNMLPEDVSFFLSCGANAVLPKPFKMSELEDLWMEHGVVGTTTDNISGR